MNTTRIVLMLLLILAGCKQAQQEPVLVEPEKTEQLIVQEQSDEETPQATTDYAELKKQVDRLTAWDRTLQADMARVLGFAAKEKDIELMTAITRVKRLYESTSQTIKEIEKNVKQGENYLKQVGRLEKQGALLRVLANDVKAVSRQRKPEIQKTAEFLEVDFENFSTDVLALYNYVLNVQKNSDDKIILDEAEKTRKELEDEYRIKIK